MAGSSESFHPDFKKQMSELLGHQYADFSRSMQQSAPVSIRINRQKGSSIPGAFVPWCSSGFYLPERPVFTLDPVFHAGAYYVQEASSMFLEQIIQQVISKDKRLRVLDLCAAPGGKSTHLLSLLPPESLLVANEVIRSRASILMENLQKWGYPNAVVTSNDPRDFQKLPGFFDVILVDAPCSGEGLFRKDEEARKEWSLDTVRVCVGRQRRILEDIWPALKTGGFLIYCTCTFNKQENEENLNWLAEQRAIENITIETQEKWGVQKSGDGLMGYRFFPHATPGEGFFISAVRKIEAQEEVRIKSKSRSSLSKKSNDPIALWIKEAEDSHFFSDPGTIHFIPKSMEPEVLFLQQHLHVLLSGTALATRKQDKLVPEHASALSIRLNAEHFPTIELGLEEALQYLRKGSVTSAVKTRGFALVTYKTLPLGWVNVLSNRINNLYPSSWRIRM